MLSFLVSELIGSASQQPTHHTSAPPTAAPTQHRWHAAAVTKLDHTPPGARHSMRNLQQLQTPQQPPVSRSIIPPAHRCNNMQRAAQIGLRQSHLQLQHSMLHVPACHAPQAAIHSSWRAAATVCCRAVSTTPYCSSTSATSTTNTTSSRRSLVVAAAAAGGEGAAAAAAAGSTHHPLIDWVQRNGGAVNGVGVANLAGSDGGAGYGLVATQAISQPGQRLVELPRSCHLTYDEASDPRVLQLIQQVPDELWGAKLALQVLVARIKGPDSPFSAYIANLPVGVSGVPMFFPREALEAIEYPPVVEQVKKRGRWLHRFSLDVLSKLPGSVDDPFEGVTVDTNSLGWALAVVSSRAFRVAGPQAPAALLPLIDMANHSFEPNCEVLPVPGGVAMVAKRQIAAGEPLLLSYGPLSNDFLLMDYGFVIPGNPHDRVALRFDINLINGAAEVGGAVDQDGRLLELSAAAPWRQALLKRLGLSGADKKSNLQVLLGGPALLEPRLLAAVRGLVATYQSEVENLTLEVLGSWDRPLNKQNETATLRILIGMALVALQNFSTGLEYDQALLTGSQTNSSSSSSVGRDGGSDGGSSAADSQSPSQQPEQPSMPAEPLVGDMQLAVLFRSQKKQLLLDVIAGLADKLKKVPGIRGLRESAVVAARKGSKPKPATKKGFGGK